MTDDGNVVDTIYDEGIEHGTVLQKGEGKEFYQLNTIPSSVPMYQSIDEKWDQSGDKATSSFDTTIGEEAKSGTTFRGQYITDQNATSQFLQYREQMGRFMREIVEVYKPLIYSRLSMLISHIDTEDLDVFYKKCNGGINFGKLFWWHVKQNRLAD